MYGYDKHFTCANAKRVVVTGAGGRTGRIIVRKLLQRGTEAFTPRAVVRSEESERKLRDYLGHLAMVDLGLTIVRADLTEPESCARVFKDIDVAIIVTGAKPQINKASLAGVIALKVATLGLSSTKPTFWFSEGASPEHIDWLSQRDQIDAAKAAGVKHIVLVSSMGGTRPGHFLNANMDNMVLWKRKSERHLVASGVHYTVIHAGGLLPHGPEKPDEEPVPGGKRQLFVGIDDSLLDAGSAKSLLPREDLAEICVQSVEASAVGRSFDLGSGPEGEGPAYGGSLADLLAGLQGRNCGYTLGLDRMEPGEAAQAANSGMLGCCRADVLEKGKDLETEELAKT